MPLWVSTLGAVFAAIATLVISWSALKPRQRIFATRLVNRWIQRVAIAFAALYVLWVNACFLLKDGPIGRGEVFLLFIADAEAVIVLLIYVYVKQFKEFIDKRNERWEQMSNRIQALESSKPPRTNAESSLKNAGRKGHF